MSHASELNAAAALVEVAVMKLLKVLDRRGYVDADVSLYILRSSYRTSSYMLVVYPVEHRTDLRFGRTFDPDAFADTLAEARAWCDALPPSIRWTPELVEQVLGVAPPPAEPQATA
jgi:hypothetical protein